MKPRINCLCALYLISIICGFGAISIAEVQFTYEEIDVEIGHPLIGDINADGHGDIIVHVHRDDTHIKVADRVKKLAWYQWPTWEKYTIFIGDMTGNRFCLGDIDGDGYLDAISGMNESPDNQKVFWYENPMPSVNPVKTSSWKEHAIGGCEIYIKDIAAGDVDGNGETDVVVRGHEETIVYFQQSGKWSGKKIKHPRKEGMNIADLDLDGDLDIILNGFWLETPEDPLNGEYEKHDIDPKWFTQKTGSWQDNCCYVGTADINQDGLLDVILSQSEKVGYPLSWYSVESLQQVKTGPWKELQIASEFPWCETVDIGDIDNDGDLDVLASKFKRHDSAGGKYANSPPYPVSVFYNQDGRGLSWNGRTSIRMVSMLAPWRCRGRR